MDRRRLLTHPAFCTAVAVVALNDRVFKPTWPGLVTGKLSDIAGVFVAAVVLALVTGRRRVGLTLAAIAFTGIKLSPGIAHLAAAALGGVTRQDPTDLVALAALWPAAWLLRTPPHSPRPGRQPLAAGLLAAVSWIAVVLTTTATSCDFARGVSSFVVDGRVVYARETRAADPAAQYPLWWVSTDAGRTWHLGDPPPATKTPGSDEPESCLDGWCVGVVDRLRVVERPLDGVATTTFQFTSEQLAAIDTRMDSDGKSGCGFRTPQFVAVHSMSVDARRIDLVAMGDQGVLRRVDRGPWERLAVGDNRPALLTRPATWPRLVILSPLLLFALAPALAVLGRKGRKAGAFAVASASGLALLVVVAASGTFAVAAPSPYVAVAVAVFTAAAAAVSACIAARRRQPLPPPAPWRWPPTGSGPGAAPGQAPPWPPPDPPRP